MKWLLGVVLLVLAAVLGYNWLVYGELRLLPPGRSQVELEVAVLEDRLDTAKEKVKAALEKGSQAGAEASREIAEARAEATRIAAELEALAKQVQRDAGRKASRLQAQARERAERRDRALKAFRRELEK